MSKLVLFPYEDISQDLIGYFEKVCLVYSVSLTVKETRWKLCLPIMSTISSDGLAMVLEHLQALIMTSKSGFTWDQYF